MLICVACRAMLSFLITFEGKLDHTLLHCSVSREILGSIFFVWNLVSMPKEAVRFELIGKGNLRGKGVGRLGNIESLV